jgi:hypothetical protein
MDGKAPAPAAASDAKMTAKPLPEEQVTKEPAPAPEAKPAEEAKAPATEAVD